MVPCLLACVVGGGCHGLSPAEPGGLTLPESRAAPRDPACESPSIDALKLYSSRDPKQRVAAVTELGRQRHPEALQRLSDAVRDHDLNVRLAAIAALGELGGAGAVQALEGLTQQQTDGIRAAAVAALAKAGARPQVFAAAKDTSWRVRMAVADALAAHPDGEASDLAQRLLGDASVEVQHRVLAAVRNWPVEVAGPVLLAGMERSAYLVRKRAAEQLAADWTPAREFPVDAPPHQRHGILARLHAEFHRQYVSPRVAAAVTAPHASSGAVIGDDRIRDDRSWQPLLGRLKSSDVSQRRQAAEELARLAATRPLPPEAVEQVAQVAAVEADQSVWRSVFRAVAADQGEASAGLARAALSHPSPEVRRGACDYLSAHPDPRHADALLHALDDSSPVVVVAATRALGLAGRLDVAPRLERLQSSPSEPLRLESAIALARLGHPAGVAALERLAMSSNVQIRLRTVQAMGELPDPSFLPTLVRSLDDRGEIALAALESLPKVAGYDVNRNHAASTTAERMRQWKHWCQSQAVMRR